MQPVLWQGQEYFTSQYFDQQYQEQKALEGVAGKYQNHSDFRRMLRNIPLYNDLLKHHHVCEVPWEVVKSGPTQDLLRLKPLFARTGYYDLILLDATAQLELTHHLNDELSKEIAYRHSHQTATQQLAPKASTPLPDELATRKLKAWQEMGRLLGTPEHITQQEAVKQIEATTGINLRPLLLAAPAQQTIAPDDVMLEPTDLAKALGFPSGYALNRALETLGWQVKAISGGWEPTPAGAPYAAQHAWTAEHGAKSGYNWKWKHTATQDALIAAGLLQRSS
jgi:hypothetical protein